MAAPIVVSGDKDTSPWWAKDISAVLTPQTQRMLEEYARVPHGKIESHIEAAREQAWQIAPWPSVGALTWLNPYIILHPAHDRVVAAVKKGASIIDCGCFVAPDLRQIAYEGCPTDHMYGFEIEPRFFDVGFNFYQDKDVWKGHFFKGDVFDTGTDSDLGKLEGKLDIVWAAKIIHLFERDTQIKVAANLVRLLKPKPGSLFVGSQNGYPENFSVPIAKTMFPGQGRNFWMANKEGFEQMWKEVAEQTGTRWNVEANLLDLRTVGLHEDDGSEYKKWTGYNLQFTCTLIG